MSEAGCTNCAKSSLRRILALSYNLFINRTFSTVVYVEVVTEATVATKAAKMYACRHNECLRLVYVACLDVGVRQLNWK